VHTDQGIVQIALEKGVSNLKYTGKSVIFRTVPTVVGGNPSAVLSSDVTRNSPYSCQPYLAVGTVRNIIYR
jgi:hypothetical protein